MSLKSSSLILMFFMSINLTFSQKSNTYKEDLTLFDSIVELENTNLFNGKRYYNLYRATPNNNNFFYSTDYVKGNVLFNNQNYYNVDLKYDLTTDKLITKLSGDKSYINIELIKDKVASFQIEDHYFININTLIKDKSSDLGFLELAYTNSDFNFFIKRKKYVSEKLNQKKVEYIFKDDDSFYLFYNNKLQQVNSYKTLKKLLPDQAKSINSFTKSNKKLLSKNEEEFFMSLFKYLEIKSYNK